MDMVKAFDEGDFLAIIENAAAAVSTEERLMLGIAYYKSGREQDALQVLEGLNIELEKLSKGLFYMGRIYAGIGEPDKARQSLERYLVFYPDDDEARDLLDAADDEPCEMLEEASAELGLLYAQQGHYVEALDVFEKVLETEDNEELRAEARKTQEKYIIKTLETWLERLS